MYHKGQQLNPVLAKALEPARPYKQLDGCSNVGLNTKGSLSMLDTQRLLQQNTKCTCECANCPYCLTSGCENCPCNKEIPSSMRSMRSLSQNPMKTLATIIPTEILNNSVGSMQVYEQRSVYDPNNPNKPIVKGKLMVYEFGPDQNDDV